MCWGVALTVAEAPRSRLGWTLLGRLVQITPPRRLGISLKLRLRRSMGPVMALSCMKSRSIVLRAASRLIVFLMVTRTVLPGFACNAMSMLRWNLRSPPREAGRKTGKYIGNGREGKVGEGGRGRCYNWRRCGSV